MMLARLFLCGAAAICTLKAAALAQDGSQLGSNGTSAAVDEQSPGPWVYAGYGSPEQVFAPITAKNAWADYCHERGHCCLFRGHLHGHPLYHAPSACGAECCRPASGPDACRSCQGCACRTRRHDCGAPTCSSWTVVRSGSQRVTLPSAGPEAPERPSADPESESPSDDEFPPFPIEDDEFESDSTQDSNPPAPPQDSPRNEPQGEPADSEADEQETEEHEPHDSSAWRARSNRVQAASLRIIVE